MRFEKFEETLKKKEQEELQKTQEQKEKLDKKLELHNEKRAAYLNDIKTKLQDHVSVESSYPNHFLAPGAAASTLCLRGRRKILFLQSDRM